MLKFLFVLLGTVFLFSGFAQRPIAVDVKAEAFYAEVMPAIGTPYRNLVTAIANNLRGLSINADSLKKVLTSDRLLSGHADIDVEALVMLVVTRSARDAEADLRAVMSETKTINQQKRTTRQGPQHLDSVSLRNSGDSLNMDELNDQQQLRLQTITDRRDRMMQTISNLLKKINDRRETIVQNLK